MTKEMLQSQVAVLRGELAQAEANLAAWPNMPTATEAERAAALNETDDRARLAMGAGYLRGLSLSERELEPWDREWLRRLSAVCARASGVDTVAD
jgi:hypothetical protein